MLSRENNPHRRLVDPDDLFRWRCIFESEPALAPDKSALENIESKLRGIFYWHAEVDGEYLVIAKGNEMAHLQRLLFKRREDKE